MGDILNVEVTVFEVPCQRCGHGTNHCYMTGYLGNFWGIILNGFIPTLQISILITLRIWVPSSFPKNGNTCNDAGENIIYEYVRLISDNNSTSNDDSYKKISKYRP